jgi:hypothetical protein
MATMWTRCGCCRRLLPQVIILDQLRRVLGGQQISAYLEEVLSMLFQSLDESLRIVV